MSEIKRRFGEFAVMLEDASTKLAAKTWRPILERRGIETRLTESR